MTDDEDIRLGIEVCQRHDLPIPISNVGIDGEHMDLKARSQKVVFRWLKGLDCVVIVFDDGTSVSLVSTEGGCLEVTGPEYNNEYWNWLSYFNSIEKVYPLSVQLAKKEYLVTTSERAIAKRKEQDFKRYQELKKQFEGGA